jgi:tetratricopeptide (TPR) repeat protein
MSIKPVFLVLALLALSGVAHAQSTEAEFLTLLKQRDAAAVEALARQRLQAVPTDDVALWAWGRVVAGDPAKRAEVLPRVEACVAARPQSARCHHVLAGLYSAMAMSGGISDGLKLAGKIKDHLVQAVKLDPNHFAMRWELSQYYLQAPGIVGGSVRKARELAREYASIDPARSRLLMAAVHTYEEEWSEAAAELSAVQAGRDALLLEDLNDVWVSLGFAQLQAEKWEPAAKAFRQVLATDADHAMAHFGLGRCLLAQNRYSEAIAAMERAGQLNPKLNVHYRIGIAYQSKGDAPKAIAAFQQALRLPLNGKSADDVRRRLKQLGVR